MKSIWVSKPAPTVRVHPLKPRAVSVVAFATSATAVSNIAPKAFLNGTRMVTVISLILNTAKVVVCV